MSAEALVIQRGYNRFSRACRGNDEIVIITSDSAFRVELVKYFLLIGVRGNIERVQLRIVGIKILFRFQRVCQTLLLSLVIVFKFIGIPVAFKGRGNLVNGLRLVFVGNLDIPFQTARKGGVRHVR